MLESLAFNIAARIEDLLYVDDINKESDKPSSTRLMSHKKIAIPYSVPLSGTPYRTTYTTPNFSPGPPLPSPARGERTPFLVGSCKGERTRRGLGVKRVLTNYLVGDPVTDRVAEGRTSRSSLDAKDSSSSISQLIDK